MTISPGKPIPLSVLLFDKATDKYVQAVIVDHTGNQIAGSPVAIPHVITGLYEYDDILMPDVDYVTAIYTVYDDALFASPSEIHLPSAELFLKGGSSESSSNKSSVTQPIVVQTQQDLVVPIRIVTSNMNTPIKVQTSQNLIIPVVVDQKIPVIVP